MRKHRNPRPRLAKPPSANNPQATAIRRGRARRLALHTTFERLAVENPRLAGAVLAVLEIVASVDRRRAMTLIEALSAVVVHSPKRAPRGRPEAS